jgi:hypothetical protein
VTYLRWWRAMKLALLSVLVLGIVVVAAGCGGGKKAASPTTTSTTATTTAGATTTESKKAATPSFASTHNCQQLDALGAQIAKSLQPTGGDLAATVANEEKLLQALASAAPSEIRADFETFVTAFGDYAQALQKTGLKPGAGRGAGSCIQVVQLGQAPEGRAAPLRVGEQELRRAHDDHWLERTSRWAAAACAGGPRIVLTSCGTRPKDLLTRRRCEPPPILLIGLA